MQLSLGFTPTIQEWIFASEGGYVDHPKDPGGATNLGITFKVLQAWYGRNITKQDVKNLTKVTAAKIYENQYWNTVRASQLPLGLDYAVFDYAVNSGPARAVRDLQRVVGADVDGVMGNLTLKKVADYLRNKSVINLITDLCEARWNFVKGLKTFATFGKGWNKRIWGNNAGVQIGDIGVADRAAKLAEGVKGIQAPTEAIPGRATPEKPSVVDLIKDPGIIAGGTAGIGTIIAAIADQPILQVALVLGIAFLVYRFVITKKDALPE